MDSCLDKLYIGSKAEEREEEIRRAIDSGETLPDLFLLTFASNGQDQLDIIDARRFFRQQKKRSALPAIVGFAIGEEESVDLVAAIARDAFLSTGGCDLKAYLLSMQPSGR